MIQKEQIVAVAAVAALAASATIPETQAETPLPNPLAAGWGGEKVCEQLHQDLSNRILQRWARPAPTAGPAAPVMPSILKASSSG